MLRAECSGTGGRPSRSSTKLSALIRSGAVSTSVPSRSNTTVRARGHRRFAIGPRAIMQVGDDRLVIIRRERGQHAGACRQDGIRDGRGQRHRACARPRVCGSGHEGDARRYRGGGAGGAVKSLDNFGPDDSAASPATLPIPQRRARGESVVRGVRKCPCGLQQCRRRRRRRHRQYLARQLAMGARRQSDGRAARHPQLPAAYPRPWRRRPHRQHRIDGRA